MHPAFSVIFFTTLSGAGYGIIFWLGLVLSIRERSPSPSWYFLMPLGLLALGGVLVSIGLLASFFHLGKKARAWRAFSQWRTSWLSREGVLAVASFLPMAALAWQLLHQHADGSNIYLRMTAAALSGLSVMTVACTAMIYASLKPIPAWRHALVVPAYLVFSLLTGGLIVASLLGNPFRAVSDLIALAVIVIAVLAWRIKRRYWRDIDRGLMPATRASALGLPADRVATVFERPHTEQNYLAREMGFVLARKHSTRLRTIAVVLFAFVPMLCVAPLFLLPSLNMGLPLAIAAGCALLGTLVERWLFFAEARHVVTLYY